MLLMGLQKLTLLDYPGRLACTVFTGGCDFRCPFCHNASLVEDFSKNPQLPTEEFFDFLSKRKGILEGVAITGGEPTVQPDLEDFIAKIREMGFSVKLDTNGNHPQKLKSILDKKLVDYVAMDIKNSPRKYGETVGIKNFDISKIEESKNMLMNGDTDFEFRTTVVKELHTAEDIEALAQWIEGTEKYFLQGFVDSGDILSAGYSGYDKETMESLLNITRQYVKTAELRGY